MTNRRQIAWPVGCAIAGIILSSCSNPPSSDNTSAAPPDTRTSGAREEASRDGAGSEANLSEYCELLREDGRLIITTPLGEKSDKARNGARALIANNNRLLNAAPPEIAESLEIFVAFTNEQYEAVAAGSPLSDSEVSALVTPELEAARSKVLTFSTRCPA